MKTDRVLGGHETYGLAQHVVWNLGLEPQELQIEPAELLKECVKNNWSLRSKQFNQKVSDAWAARWPSLGDSKL
eukprot:4777290-Amphidinium_carterae.1